MPLIESRLRVQVKTAEYNDHVQSSFLPWMWCQDMGVLPGPPIAIPEGARYLVGPRSRHLDDAGLRRLVREADRRGWLGLSLVRCEDITGAGLKELRRLGGLRALSLCQARVGPDDLQVLADLPDLEWLDLRFTAVDDVALSHLRHLRRLRYLALSETEVTGTGLVHLLPLTELSGLLLGKQRGRARIEETSLLLLDELPSLRHLDLSAARLSDVALAALGGLSRLELLSLDARDMTGYALRHLSGLSGLRHLGLSGMREVRGHLRRLRHLPLRTLDLDRAQLSRDSLLGLSGQSIESLGLFQLKLDDDAFRPVSCLPQLRRLRLYNHKLTDKAMPYLAACENMEDLTLSEMEISDAGMWYLSTLRKVRKLHLNHLPISEDSLLRLPGMFLLEELDLSCTDVYEEGLAMLANFPRLTRFSHGWGFSWKNAEQYEEPAYARLTDRGMRHLAPLRGLRRLNLLGTYVTDEGLRHLRDLRQLEHLDLQGLFTGPGLRHLSGMKDLTWLNLKAPLCDEHLLHLRRLPKLAYLLLYETLITDEGVKVLRALRSVHSLSVDDAAISERGLAELRAVPTLEHLNREELKRGLAPDRPTRTSGRHPVE